VRWKGGEEWKLDGKMNGTGKKYGRKVGRR
jgi:hypothetical protein